MNKFMSFTSKGMLALLLLVFVAGCGSNDSTGEWNAPDASSNEITAYSLSGTDGIAHDGLITEGTTPKTIDVVMPFGTDPLLPLIATYTTTGASVKIDTEEQQSGVTENVFPLSPPASAIYTVTAADGVTIATYEVNVTVAESDVAIISAYSIDGNEGLVDEDAVPNKTIDVEMPFGTTETALETLVATYVAIGEVKVETELQVSGSTPNDFSVPVLYTVTAADSVTTATYEVNVTIATSDAAVMTSYSLDGVDGTISEDTDPKTITVVMPNDDFLTIDLIATFTTSPGASVKIVDAVQTSAETLNDFSTQVVYTVTAADNTTTAEYYVDVSLDTNPTAPDLGEAGRFVILASQTITTTGAAVISDGDMGITKQARTYLTTGGFTPGANPGEFDQLTGGLSYAPDDNNTTPTAYLVPYPFPLKTATETIGTEWITTAAMLTQAETDLTTAYNFLAGTNPTGATQTLASTQLGGQILTAGVYYSAASVLITETPLQLDALGDTNAVWIFNIDGTLTAGAPTGGVEFVGGVGQAKNVYWRTGGDTIIEGGTTFIGSVFAYAQINVLNDANVTGSLFALTEQVTTGDSTITKAP